MPLPAIIWGGAAILGIIGGKKAIDAHNNNSKADSMIEDAKDRLERAKRRLNRRKESVNEALQELGRLRLTTEAGLMRRFIEKYKLVKNLKYKQIDVEGRQVQISAGEFKVMVESSDRAVELVRTGIEGLGTGVLAGIGASSVASMVGVASTGTAISTLSGVAATNATLAWLGGGSLAAGGFGMTGGMVVLGGCVAGPALAVIGFLSAAKSEETLTRAYEEVARVDEIIEQLDSAICALDAIKERIDEITSVITEICQRFEQILIRVENFMNEKEGNRAGLLWRIFGAKDAFYYNNFSQEEQKLFEIFTLFGVALNKVLRVQVFDERGALTSDSERAVSESREMISCG